MLDKPILSDHATFEEAEREAVEHGLAVAEKHYFIERIEGDVAIYNTSVLTGAYLTPRGHIQKTRDGWSLLRYS